MPLELHQLIKSYVHPDGGRLPVLDVPEFGLDDAAQVAVRGGSGTGKTTLLHVIAGIIAPDAGRVVIDGLELTALGEARRDAARGRLMGYVFQSHHLLPAFTALENVLLGMSFASRRPDRAWGEHLLEEVGLKDRLGFAPRRLSVGQRQRVAVARALANRPRLVLADEPTGSLDPANAQQVTELIQKLCGEAGAMLLLVSHDRAVTDRFARTVELAEINRASLASGVGVSAPAGEGGQR